MTIHEELHPALTTGAAAEYLDVYGADDKFLMRTTMPVMRQVFEMQKEAVARCEREIHEPGGVCTLYMNRRCILGQARITVQLAVGPRSNY